jgi:hypothetical protein
MIERTVLCSDCMHCLVYAYVEWVLHVMSPSVCSFIVCWFPLYFTTCFGLHGHLQVCRILHIFMFIYLKILFRCFFGSLPFFTWSHSVCFPFVFCSCAVFLRVFGVFLLMCLSACCTQTEI